jgi:hypothetical protein
MKRFLHVRPSPAMVVASAALFVSLSGVGYAAIVLPANSVGTKQLKRNAVTSAKVKQHSLLRSDFKRGQVPRGPRGIQGIQGIQGAQGTEGAQGIQGAQGDPGTPATRLWAYLSSTGTLRGGGGVVASSRLSDGYFSVTFNQSIVNCAATAGYLRESTDVSVNVSNHLAVTRSSATELRVYIWNSSMNDTVNIPFGLIVVC